MSKIDIISTKLFSVNKTDVSTNLDAWNVIADLFCKRGIELVVYVKLLYIFRKIITIDYNYPSINLTPIFCNYGTA